MGIFAEKVDFEKAPLNFVQYTFKFRNTLHVDGYVAFLQ